MNFTKKIFLIILLLGISAIIGFKSAQYISYENVFNFAIKFLMIPIILVGVFLSIINIYFTKYSKTRKFFAFVFGIFPMTFISFLIFFGNSIWINYLGNQQDYFLKGKVINTQENKEKLLSKKNITLNVKMDKDTIEIDVPDGNYQIGDAFSKKMKVGCLGFVYSK